MGDSSHKPLCKLMKKDYMKKQFDTYVSLINAPQYVCRKCGRAVNDPKNVCKPEHI